MLICLWHTKGQKIVSRAAIWALMLVSMAFASEALAAVSIGSLGDDFNLAISSLGATRETLWIDQPCRVVADVQIPESITVKVLSGGTIHQGHHTVIFNGLLEAENYRIFTGEGRLKILNNPEVRLEWFGVDSTEAAATNSRRLAQGLNALPDRGGCKVTLDRPGNYFIDTSLEVTTGNRVLQFGPEVMFTMTRKKDGLLIHGNNAQNRISDIVVKNFVLNGSGNSICGINVMYCDRLILENCRVWNNSFDGIYFGGIGVDTSWDCKIINCEISNSGVFGIIAVGTHNLEVAGCKVYQCTNKRGCASAIQIKNSINFNVHHNFTDGGEHGINIRCSSKGSDTTGICENNESRNAVKAGVYIHHDTIDGGAGELHDVVIRSNRIYNTGWMFLSVSAAADHMATDILVTGNIGQSAGSNGMNFTNARSVTCRDNQMSGIHGRGLVLVNVVSSTFSGGHIKRSKNTSYPVVIIRNGRHNAFTDLTLSQSFSLQPCILEEDGSDFNVFTGNKIIGCDSNQMFRLAGKNSRFSSAPVP